MELEPRIRDGHPMDADQSDADERWWDGRQVAIRPDVPSRAFDPQDLILIKSDEERVSLQNRINQHVAEQKEGASDESLWPSWLCERPAESSP